MGTTRSTPAYPSSSSRATCSRSPIAPITVTSSPWLMWVRAPTLLTRSTTASTSCWVAVDFITIIILCVLSSACKLYESRDGGFHPTGGFFGARLGGGALVRARTRGAERLAKSPGVGVGVRVAAEIGGGAATVAHRAGSIRRRRGCQGPPPAPRRSARSPPRCRPSPAASALGPAPPRPEPALPGPAARPRHRPPRPSRAGAAR